MKCEKCKTERKNGGEYYEFYYGTEVGKETKDVTYRHPGTPSTMTHYETTTRYRIAGSANAFLCYRCMYRVPTSFIPLLFATFVVLLIFGVVYDGPEYPEANIGFAAVGVLSGVLGCILIVLRKRANKWFELAEKGDQESIKIISKWLSPFRSDREREQTGDLIAITLREADLRRQGYNGFFTRQQYAELKSDRELNLRDESDLRDLISRHR